MKSTKCILIMLSLILGMAACNPRCGFDREPYFYLYFVAEDSCFVGLDYNPGTNTYDSVFDLCYMRDDPGYLAIEGDNLAQDLDAAYEGEAHEGGVQLPIDMNRDYVQFYLVGAQQVDTLRVTYNREFFDQSKRCGVVLTLSQVKFASNMEIAEAREGDADPENPIYVSLRK